MAYDVKFTVPERPLGKTGISFVVRTAEDGKDSILGTLKISKAALVWFPENATNGHKIRWERFDKMAKTFPGKESR
jgi:hypothetical protein